MNDYSKEVDEKLPQKTDEESRAMLNQQVEGKFRKVKLDPINMYGRYRGKGSLQLTAGGLKISGRHVFSLGTRWVIGLGLFFGSLFLSTAATGGAGYCAPGFIPIYFLVEYLILKREEVLVPFSDITQLAVDSNNSLIGIDFKGNSQCSPVFMETSKWKGFLSALQQMTTAVDVSEVQAKKQKSSLIIVLVIIFISIVILGIIAALAIPNLLVAKQRAMQRSAITDIQEINVAISDYFIDNPELSVQGGVFDADSELYNALVPLYSTRLPIKDPWGHNYLIYLAEACRGKYGISENDIAEWGILVVSYGRDGLKDSWMYNREYPEEGWFSTRSINDFSNDLVLFNSVWIRGPNEFF